MTITKTGIFTPYEKWNSNKRKLEYLPPHFYTLSLQLNDDDDFTSGVVLKSSSVTPKIIRSLMETIETQTIGYWWSTNMTSNFVQLGFESEHEATYISLLFK